MIPKNKKISITLPEDYVGKEVEVIAFQKGEGETHAGRGEKTVSFDALALDTTGFKFNRDEANER